jgi:hypothetical protein
VEIPDAGGEPAFAYRDVAGVPGSMLFHLRNRTNGHFSFLPEKLGGSESYGPPMHVHTFYSYVPPRKHFRRHPEFYSEIDGRRTAEKGQLCLTNERLADLVTARLRRFIKQGRRQAAKRGQSTPRLYDFSQNDWSRPCRCAACERLAGEEGGHAGALVRFVNRIADGVAGKHPGVLIDTLAYGYTLEPPRSAALRDNVALRFAALEERDFLAPLADQRELRRALEGWRGKTAHLRIWAYSVSFGFEAHNLPMPNLPALASDFRYYRDLGVEGVFLQHYHPVAADLGDLKLWVLVKLLEDPARDAQALVEEFTDGYYGAAGPRVREYLERLERAARGHALYYPMEPGDYDWLDPAFLRDAQALFDRAEGEVGEDETLRMRLRHARLSLDRATLWRWDPQLARPGGDDLSALDPAAILERVRGTALEQIERRLTGSRAEDHRRWVEAESQELRDRLGLPARPAGRGGGSELHFAEGP